MENNHNPMEDDGSLDFLKIPADETNKHFNCPETTQQKLINLTPTATHASSSPIRGKSNMSSPRFGRWTNSRDG